MTFKNHRRMSLKKKLTYLYLPLMILPMIAFAMLSGKLYRDSIVNRSLLSMVDSTSVISERVDDVLEQAENAATYLTISINNLVNNISADGVLSEDVKMYSLLSNELAYSKLIFKDVESIAFIDTSNRIYYSDIELVKDYPLLGKQTLIDHVADSAGTNLWFDMQRRSWMTLSGEEAVVTLGKKVWNINTGKTIGYLFINISEKTLSSGFEQELVEYMLVDDSYQIVSSVKKEKLFDKVADKDLLVFMNLKGASHNLIKGTSSTSMFAKNQLDKLPWTLVAVGDLKSFTADMTNLIVLTAVMLASIILLVVMLSYFVNHWITRPILLLKKGVEVVSSGDFTHRIQVTSSDELGLFAKSFNTMSSKIEELLIRISQEEERKRHYELALIQEQIKPHFLYNTLDIIMKLIEMKQNKKAKRATMTLADFYKQSLSGGADQIRLRDELRIVEDYLTIQNIRYEDMFSYNIDVEEEMLEMFVPKLSLQPFVENAIYHGLKYKDGQGELEIISGHTSDDFVLMIKDNGIGIEKDRLRVLNRVLEQSEPEDDNKQMIHFDGTKHFGIINVRERLRLLLGETCHLKIESETGVGTTVVITIKRSEKDA
ncbi:MULTISPECIES: sensor histidine kinase [unclassified Fusibacter]|uniref:sensor histidine kinase n=1 Tax=unclassified Fusibacter TaxID=2624464 RepID=UPI001011F0B7|nr:MULTISPECIES: sensor histidine kinase [unclassified Fusibacter]MCK8060083.1 sensor histidine kinase [Fusibacter sp. A2]NPE22225.1 sensor histidine kinase [Fusibacter sp. A1]RXV60999.1 sensor histidine kinase [Fusibacter sp. A1]